jgi:hypothetical protein
MPDETLPTAPEHDDSNPATPRVVIMRLDSMATTLVESWPTVTAVPGDRSEVMWAAANLAETITALLAGEPDRAAGLARGITELVAGRQENARAVAAGEAKLCPRCGDIDPADVEHTCFAEDARE